MDLYQTPLSEIQSLLMSQQLFMLDSAYDELYLFYNPNRIQNQFSLKEISPYSEFITKQIQKLPKVYSLSQSEIVLSDQYDSTELPEGSLAYHSIIGPIMSDSYWYFSSTQFERNFLAAENNQQISAHFIYCKSPGGEAYYLDAVSATLRAAKKPIYVFVRQMCCSAAYYICCHAKKIACNTQNDTIGSLGTMISFFDWDSYYIKEGIKKIQVKATKSDLKNKKMDDLIDGKPKQFIDEMMDPINEQFLNEVKLSRKIISKFDDSNPVLRGETFRAEIAMSAECGLIDSITTLPEAIKEAHELGQRYLNMQSTQKSITKFI